MAVPRPVLLALLGLAVVASVFLVTRQHGSNESVTAHTAKPAVTPSTPTPAAREHSARGATSAKHGKARARHSTPAKPAAPVARPATRPAPAHKPAGAAVPTNVQAAAEALAKDEVVVLFFSDPTAAADDTGARTAVRSLRGMRRVEIFDAGLDQVAAFRPMLSSLGITQVPATVIVRPGKRAVLFQGFVDAGTLRQNVADALR